MLSRIKVSHKLLLIYALDMIAVIFLGFSLAEEKFLSINFARRELVGIDYIASARETLFAALASERPPGLIEERVRDLREAETRLGAGMETAGLVEAAVDPLRSLDHGGGAAPAIAALHRVIARIGDMSNLILDPDLDSYYTMSLVVLRFPDLVETLSRLRHESTVSTGSEMGGHATLAVLQGQLSAISKGIEDDLAAGIRGNHDGSLKLALSDRFAPLSAALIRLNAAMAPEVIVDGLSAQERSQLTGAVNDTLAEAKSSWTAASTELNRLIGLRIDGFFLRMYEHFALAGILLSVILTLVLMVARRIAKPIADLAQVADQVRINNDYSLRARWDSGDEIGRLVIAFNTMLERLQTEGARRQEMAAQARAAEAQRELIAAISTPLLVVRLSDLAVIHANEPAEALLGSEGTGSWLPRVELERLITALGDHGEVNEFEAECHGLDGTPFWALMSARHLVFQNQDAVLVIVTPINERRRMEEELRHAKTGAEKALQDLREAQHNLIQAEKMASLGGLVAGVAHEINTPVGIGLTGASTLAVETDRIRKLYQSDDMSQSDFEEYLDIANRSTRLLMSNMERAASLIQSFKQVAVDQVSDERRCFDLADYIDEVLTSLHPALRKSGIEIGVECPSGLEIDGFPGGLSQVLTNLVLNAINHGFEGGRHGKITITADQPDAASVRVRVGDDGKGIPSANLGRIFDPFFTTRRTAGGSGLGLHIVYNIVTGTLKGGIEVDSAEGVGTTFSIVFPRIAEKIGVRDVA
ncbi:ATP-binding protein [Magnetospirillum fulvum]|uniref:histidine kinase n=1 Tax=Magnetospirillum fulvum TaxID=1082 RepID=A0A1H6I6L2_MAGFU|nr:ATP-binding protein [Magnetospirillum fulvum]SEH43828.1 HAMP domain-containing protein [Magnetospirillum fulvum]